jgi:hypothetical protein
MSQTTIYPCEVRQVLMKLLELTRIEPPPTIELYYAADTVAGVDEFVNVDEMPEKGGVTFRQLIENNARRKVL